MRSGVSSTAIGWRCIDRPLAARVIVRRKSNARRKLKLLERARIALLRRGGRASASNRVPGRMSSSGTAPRDQSAIARASALATPARRSSAAKLSPSLIAEEKGRVRPLGRFGERRDQVVRRHALAGVGAPGERRDRLRAGIVPCRAGQRARACRRRSAARSRATAPRSRAASAAQVAAPRHQSREPIRAPRSGVQSMLAIASRSRSSRRRRRDQRDQRGRTRGACRPPGRDHDRCAGTHGENRPRNVVADPPPAQAESLWRRVVKVKLTRRAVRMPCGEPCSARRRVNHAYPEQLTICDSG